MGTYIHEDPGWPHFRWDKSRLAERLSEVRFRQGLLIGRLEALGFGERREAAFEALVQEVRRSSEIEGEVLDEGQVKSSVAKRLGMSAAGLPEPDRSVEGVVALVLDATQNYGQPLSRERLWDWHSMLFPEPRSRRDGFIVGGWRNDRLGPMQVVSGPIGREKVHFEAPEAGRLDQEMNRLLNWYEGPEEAGSVLKASIAHLWFVTNHPFDDGNGRIGRAVMDMALARSEQRSWRPYSMSSQIRKERSRYYEMLESTQRDGLDVTRWIEWFLDCLLRAFEGSEGIVSGVLKRARFWQAHAQAIVNDRQRAMLSRLLEGFEGKLTNAKWAKVTKCSPDTALRDLNDLVAKGVLVKEPAGGRSTSYSLKPTS